MNKDYNNQIIGQPLCTYNALGRVYSGQPATGVARAPNPYTVPKFCPNGPVGANYPPSYDTLSHGSKGCNQGHFAINSAYPQASCGNPGCNIQFVNRDCRGNILGACATNAGQPEAPVQTEGYCGSCEGYKKVVRGQWY